MSIRPTLVDYTPTHVQERLQQEQQQQQLQQRVTSFLQSDSSNFSPWSRNLETHVQERLQQEQQQQQLQERLTSFLQSDGSNFSPWSRNLEESSNNSISTTRTFQPGSYYQYQIWDYKRAHCPENGNEKIQICPECYM